VAKTNKPASNGKKKSRALVLDTDEEDEDEFDAMQDLVRDWERTHGDINGHGDQVEDEDAQEGEKGGTSGEGDGEPTSSEIGDLSFEMPQPRENGWKVIRPGVETGRVQSKRNGEKNGVEL
jgi:hypothetical protein